MRKALQFTDSSRFFYLLLYSYRLLLLLLGSAITRSQLAIALFATGP